jgi:hypothetical protein
MLIILFVLVSAQWTVLEGVLYVVALGTEKDVAVKALAIYPAIFAELTSNIIHS